MKKHYLLLLLSLFGFQQFSPAQPLYNQTPEFLKGNSIWAFPDKVGLDFNSGTGVSITTEMPADGQMEGSASVCDRNTGDLLFYTNGETIWNANHQPMPNGTGLFGNGLELSTRQGAVIIPFLEDSNKYYVFSLTNVDHAGKILNPTAGAFAPDEYPQVFIDDNGDTVGGSLFYSVVDMTLENSLGNVVPGQKNILLDSTSLGEAMIAIPGSCSNIWLLVHTAGPPLSNDPPQYKAYEITAAGINTTPVLSTGKVHATRSWLTVSPDRSTIAITGGGANSGIFLANGTAKETGLEVARFDIQTGEVNSPIIIEDFDNTPLTPNLSTKDIVSAGCAFSPDGTMLYYDMGNYRDTFYIMQCDVSNFDSTVIANSKVRIAANPSNSTLPELNHILCGFRLYKDTLYVVGGAYMGSTPPYYLASINNPNAAGAACDFQPHSLLVIGEAKGGTLGSETVFVPSADTVINTRDSLICKGWTSGVQLAPTQDNGMYYTWSDNSTDSVLSINQGGTYWVSYYTEDCNLFYSDTFHITEGTMQQPVITVDVHVLSTTLSYSTYQWLLNDVAINGATQQDYTVQENGFYRVVVTNEQGCVDTSDSYEVTNVSIDDVHQLAQQIQVWPNPVKEEVFVRSPVPVKLSLSSISGKVIQQAKLSNSLSMQELAAGMYLLRISDKEGRLLKVEKLIKSKEQ